ncbi:pentatricopeptide repeat-containing protein At4g21705, mitochondrial isoform X1 [Impatiens glandulifera]|uniref:pentatricopeptide repeat-containing protein At4g21705, mitochondrial isoform X1 n=1 Tax=Impatiens glandulifera TaxID=253017 RepID=UPI001FB0A402|nr:pentatricopeptide repeat-containing protein At4g21705, mitochondrial isoform X1 [Impatiens glandulifera]
MDTSRRFVGNLTRINLIWASIRCYYTSRGQKPNLYSIISPLGSRGTCITPELDSWVKNDNKLNFDEIQRIIHDLRKRKRFSHALEVSEWMNKRGIFEFTPTEHAVQLDLIGRVRGFMSAETYFNNLTEEEKTIKTYGALLNCYVRQRQTDKAFSHLQKMKDKGFASAALTYNNIMCLYTNIGEHEKIPDVFTEMHMNNVSPDNYSYRIILNSYGLRSDIKGMEKVLKVMESQLDIVVDWNTYAVVANIYTKVGQKEKAIDALRKAEARLDNKDGLGYNHLISLYATLGKKYEVLRLWELEKKNCKRCINRDYISIVSSLVNMNEFDEAEKVLKEWESAGTYYDFRVPNRVILAYFNLGLIEKGAALLDDLQKKGRATPASIWFKLAEEHLRRGNSEEAKAVLKLAISLHAGSIRRKPSPKVMEGILNWVGDSASVDEVKGFVDILKSLTTVNRQIYHAMLKKASQQKSDKVVEWILASMKNDKIDEDEETRRILDVMQDKC